MPRLGRALRALLATLVAAAAVPGPCAAAAAVSPARGRADAVRRAGGVEIHGQTVFPADHVFAGQDQVTLIVQARNAAGVRTARGVGEVALKTSIADVAFVNVDVARAAAVVAQLEADKDIKYVEFDSRVEALPDRQVDDDGGRARRLAEAEPYGIEMVLENVTWWQEKFAEGPPPGSAKVCVVDTGYGNGHEDLPILNNADGFNPYYDGEWYIDGHGRGTQIAGIIGALGGNSKGVVGVIPSSLSGKFSFFIGKGLEDDGSGTNSGMMEAVQKCVDNNSTVISMFGGIWPYNAWDDQFYRHYKNDDVLIVAPAGNSGNSALNFPAAYQSVMSVAAVDPSEYRAGFSQFNEQVEIAGPGVAVTSTVTGNSGSTFGYTTWSSTSMATPHVAAVAGLLRMFFPDCKAFQIRHAMLVTAKDRGAADCDFNYGYGIVKAQAAFEHLQSIGCDSDEAFSEPRGGCTEVPCTYIDCDDSDPNTIDTCESGVCVSVCGNNAACDDGDTCTEDTCEDGVCRSEVKVDGSDCDDGDPNTIDTCESGFCVGVCGNNAACDDGNTCTEDTCEDGVCRHFFKFGSVPVTVLLLTDAWPTETEWNIVDASSGDVMLDGGNYTKKNATHTSMYCAEEAHNATFTITDSSDDGICCAYGTGGYEIKVGLNQVAAGGEFGSSETKTFAVPAPYTPCVPDPNPNPNPAYKFAAANECEGGAPLDEDQCEALASLLGFIYKGSMPFIENNPSKFPGGCFVKFNKNKVFYNNDTETGLGCSKKRRCVCGADEASE